METKLNIPTINHSTEGKLQIVYKLVTMLSQPNGRNKLQSSNSRNKLDYTRKNRWVKPEIAGSRIFVFDSIDAIKIFKVCRGMDNEKFFKMLRDAGQKVLISVGVDPVEQKYRTGARALASEMAKFWQMSADNVDMYDSRIQRRYHFSDGVSAAPQRSLGVTRLLPVADWNGTNENDYSFVYKKTISWNNTHVSTNFNCTNVSSLNHYILEYKLNTWTRPKIAGSKLFVFPDAEKLKRFNAGQRPVDFLCVGKNPIQIPFAPRLRVSRMEMLKIENFWKRTSDTSDQDVSPCGTTFVESVLPIFVGV